MSTEEKIIYDCSTDFLHDFMIDVEDSFKPRFVCPNCGLWINALSVSSLSAFLSEVQLFNYGTSLYRRDIINRDIAWTIIDTGIEIALLKLPVKDLDRLKRLQIESTKAVERKSVLISTSDEDLTYYKFVDRHGKTRSLSTFFWHTWRVVKKLLERDGFSSHGQEEKEKEVQQQSENGVSLH